MKKSAIYLSTAVLAVFCALGALLAYAQAKEPPAPAAAGVPPDRARAVVYESVELLRYEESGQPYLHDVRTNNTGRAIASTRRAMLAFDRDGQPLKLQWQILDSSDEPAYECVIEDDAPLAPGETRDVPGGWSLYDAETMPGFPPAGDGGPNRVAYALYCDKQITFADGTVWENPAYDAWAEACRGKPAAVEALEAYYPFAQAVP